MKSVPVWPVASCGVQSRDGLLKVRLEPNLHRHRQPRLHRGRDRAQGRQRRPELHHGAQRKDLDQSQEDRGWREGVHRQEFPDLAQDRRGNQDPKPN